LVFLINALANLPKHIYFYAPDFPSKWENLLDLLARACEKPLLFRDENAQNVRAPDPSFFLKNFPKTTMALSHPYQYKYLSCGYLHRCVKVVVVKRGWACSLPDGVVAAAAVESSTRHKHLSFLARASPPPPFLLRFLLLAMVEKGVEWK
jgi:hypothetical protein